ncbi:ybaR, partial [Symbiodinium necroappetens]
AFLVSLLLPKISTRVPSALVAILLGTAFEWAIARCAFDTQTPIVGDIASQCDFPIPFWFNSIYHPPAFSKELLLKVLPLSVTMA